MKNSFIIGLIIFLLAVSCFMNYLNFPLLPGDHSPGLKVHNFPDAEISSMNIHGAGTQKSEPKSGYISDFFQINAPGESNPRIYNYARAVRSVSDKDLPYSIVDTGQKCFFDNNKTIPKPLAGEVFYGQDAAYPGLKPSFSDNGDGSVTDNNTGLIWKKSSGLKMTYKIAQSELYKLNIGRYRDWRIPTVKELYSLIQFSDCNSDSSIFEGEPSGLVPYLEDNFFSFESKKEADVNAESNPVFLSSTKSVSGSLVNEEVYFGVNFSEGTITGDTLTNKIREGDNDFHVFFVRSNNSYGNNDFVDNKNGTITDRATGLMWMAEDEGPMNWAESLTWAENLELSGYDDWRLPDAKELQSLIDYSRSPGSTASAAIDPLFSCTEITDETGGKNYPFYWSSTTHTDFFGNGSLAVYLAFGDTPRDRKPFPDSYRSPGHDKEGPL